MLSLSRTFLKAGSAGYHFLAESRYGNPNAPFFGLYPKTRAGQSLLLDNNNSNKIAAAAAAAADSTAERKVEKQATAEQAQQSGEGGFMPHMAVEDDPAYDLFGGSHNAVSLTRTEVAHAMLYCRAVVALCAHVPNSRDWLAGWAATITSNGDLVDCALQAPACGDTVGLFCDNLQKRKELSDAQKALVIRCLIYDAITAAVRARGATEMNGVEEFVRAHFNNETASPEGKTVEKKDSDADTEGASSGTAAAEKERHDEKSRTSSWIDDIIAGVDTTSSEQQHPLRPILRFAREQKYSDQVIAEMFSLALQEVAVAEEKFSLIADGSTVSHLL